MAEVKGYVATTKFLIASPTKVRPVAHVVSRRNCTEALAILDNMPQKGASLIKNTLKSAIANALYANKNLDEDSLYVKEIRIDEGPRLKRVWFRARGRADQLLRRMCHITVIVAEKAGE
ncbi:MULTISPECIES: 50S ribosomal protein L22 [Treponema]|uniref:50S ribosomal protein L22 n=1 Tax=Treponema TaxID=157 RepID=UPI000593D54A|nr:MULTISPECIES: 50S ribosomal protein L22 [Treponema]MBQ5538272.1 50S ribosomal protein L22 [Treponema sp.]